ncbi:MAG: lysophospholipid acyltransferase family protein [Candidatus Binatia bacterium]
MSYSLKLALISLLTLIVGPFVIALAPFDRQGRRAYSLARLWTDAILKISGVRLKVQGLERLDAGRPYIFLANHQSYIDIPALVEALSQFQLRLIAKKELAWFPVFGWALRLSKHIMIDRSGRAHAMTSLRRAKEKISQGFSVVIFPEGTRGRTSGVLPFKRGGFVLGVMAQVPIVPVTIVGSGKILPRGDWRIRKGEIEIVVDEPIVIERQDLKNLGQLSTRVRAVILSRLNGASDARSLDAVTEGKRSGEARAQG